MKLDLNNNGVDDLEELSTFIRDIGTDLLEDAAAAWEWLKQEAKKITALFADAMVVIKAAVLKALGDVLTRPLGEIVADTLTILYREARHIAEVVSSDFITALIGLTSAPRLVEAK